MVDTAHPDIRMIHRKVRQTIAASAKPQTSHAHHHHVRATTVTGGSIGSMNAGYAANDASNLSAAC